MYIVRGAYISDMSVTSEVAQDLGSAVVSVEVSGSKEMHSKIFVNTNHLNLN